MMANEEYLRTAQPRLIVRMDPQTNGQFKRTSRIDEVERGWDEIVDEGYDPPGNSPLGPVYWRAVTRGEEQLYLSTFVATRDSIMRLWGSRGLDYCDPITGTAVARVETNVTRGGEEQLYLNTFVATRDSIMRAWGSRGLEYFDRFIGMRRPKKSMRTGA